MKSSFLRAEVRVRAISAADVVRARRVSVAHRGHPVAPCLRAGLPVFDTRLAKFAPWLKDNELPWTI